MSASFVQASGAKKADHHSIVRAVKITAALAVVATGAYAVLSEQGYVATENAVVSAYVVSLRVPIEGYVSGSSHRVGAEIHQGDILARVDNPRVDDQRLADLRTHLSRIGSDLASSLAERVAFLGKRAELISRSDDYRRLLTQRMAEMEHGLQQSVDAKLAQREQTRKDLDRKLALVRSGVVSKADLDRSQAAFAVADKEAALAQSQLQVAQFGTAAAVNGVLTDGGSNDVSYSMQRADEIDIHLTQIDQAIAALTAEHAETEARLLTEDARIKLLSSNSLTSPASGMVWKLGASNGERLSAGDMAAEVVDCNAAFIVASVPQTQFSNIKLGAEARFRLSGESIDRVGHVMSVTGEASLAGDRNMASVPLSEHSSTAFVRVSVPASGNVAGECLVGRTARVLLPVTGGGVFARIVSFFTRYI